MKRRSFVQKLSAGTSLSVLPVFMSRNRGPEIYNPYLKMPSTINEARSQEGYIMVRLAFTGKGVNKITNQKGKIDVANGKIHRIKRFFFEHAYDELEWVAAEYDLALYKNDTDIVVIWIDDASTDTTIVIKQDRENIIFSLNGLFEKPETVFEKEEITLTANLLFDKEIGKIDAAQVGIRNTGENFRFAIVADPQGGEPDAPRQDSPTRVKIHNAFVEETIARINELKPKPAFSAVIGDFIDSKGQMENFIEMKNYFKHVNNPVLLEVGNHETTYGAKFSPGYNMRELDNYFSIQKEMNGMNKILYSFDLGRWHFIVWPDPLRSGFWPAHPHYFDWLERDLDAHKDQAVIFMQHIPVHPVGINPLINYAETIDVKRMLINILSKHGNVKYVFSGHVHIPLKASVKTAVTINGIKFINLPAAGYRPRAFGEEDFYGGPTQGFAYVDIEGEQARVFYKNVTKEIYEYPETLINFNQNKYSLWLNHKWELPANKGIENGDFGNGLNHWHQRFVYKEDENPSNLMEVRSGEGKAHSNALYLYTRKRGYDTPGQDRMPQTINRICQVVSLTEGNFPLLRIRYKVDKGHYHPGFWSGAFIWIEGFKNSLKRLNLCYSVGKMYGNIGGRFSQISNIRLAHFDVPVIFGDWANMVINPAMDHMQNPEHVPFYAIEINKLVVNIGTWSINDGYLHEFGIYVDNIGIEQLSSKPGIESNVNGADLNIKNSDDIYYFRNQHTSGEHQYASQEELYPTKHK